jgi:hypothetical protein
VAENLEPASEEKEEPIAKIGVPAGGTATVTTLI